MTSPSLTSDNFNLTVSSDGSDFFQDNTEANFQIKLQTPLNFAQGSWKVALLNFHYNNTIDNLGEESISFWNGVNVQEIILPPWNCHDHLALIKYLNQHIPQFDSCFKSLKASTETFLGKILPKRSVIDLEFLKNFDVTEIPPHAPGTSEYPLTSRTQVPEPPPLTRKRRSAEDNIYPKPHKTPHAGEFLSRQPQPPQASDFLSKLTQQENNISSSQPVAAAQKKKEAEESDDEEESGANEISEHDKPSTPSRDLRRRTEEITAEEEDENIEPNPHDDRKPTIQNAVDDYTDFKNPNLTTPSIPYALLNRFYAPKFEESAFKTITFNLDMCPDFDFGISDTLLSIIGFEKYSNFTLQKFKIRQFFRTYLNHYSKNVTFLNNVFFQKLSRNESLLKNTNEYWLYIQHIITKVLRIETLNVWYDFTLNNETTDLWPINTKWVSFINKDDFINFVQKIERISKEGIFTDNKPTYFNSRSKNKILQNRGTIIAYYILKKLFRETPRGQNIHTTIPPNIYFPNNTLFIYSNIIDHTLMNETSLPLLAVIQPSKESGFHTEKVVNVQYRKCIKSNGVNTIRFYISSLLGTPVKFLRGPIILQLRFQRFPDNSYLI